MPSSSPFSVPLGFVKSSKVTKDRPHMNQVLSPSSPMFLPLTQLDPHCSRLLSLVSDHKASRKELIASEQMLWREVKKLKALQEKANIFTYLIGFYHTILYQLAKLNESDDIFQYHILIRLGDLNRYLDRLDVAEYYYCNARNLFPNYGHAYNQLGLLTKTENFYKSCYYYSRAAKSIKQPLDKNLAESNLRIVITEHENTILSHISNDDPSINNARSSANSDEPETQLTLPASAFEWFYVMIVAICFDNILPAAKPFMNFMTENFSTQRATVLRNGIKTTTTNCDRESYLLMASLDILLDWSKVGKQGKSVCLKIGNELRQIRASICTLISSLESTRDSEIALTLPMPTSAQQSPQTICGRPFSGPGNSTPVSPTSLNTSNESALSSVGKNGTHDSKDVVVLLPALPHDCVLKGFKPLETVHEQLRFPRELPIFNGSNGKLDEFGDGQIVDQSFIGPVQLLQILSRIKAKIDSFGPLLKRRTRNIALESILSSMRSGCNPD